MGIRAILLLTLFLLIAPLRGQAQDEWQVITADNAAQLQEIRRLGNGRLMNAVAWSPDGNWIAAAGSIGIWVYDTNNLDAEPAFLEGHSQPVLRLAFSPDGLTLVSSGYDGAIIIWDFVSQTQRFVIETQSQPSSRDWVHNLTFRSDGVLVTGHYGEIRFWDVNTSDEIMRLQSVCGDTYVTDITFSEDGSLMACLSQYFYGDADFRFVGVWDFAADATIELREKPVDAVIDSVELSADNSQLIGVQHYCRDCDGSLLWTWSLVDPALEVTETTLPLPSALAALEVPWMYLEYSFDATHFAYIEGDTLNVGDTQTGDIVSTPSFFTGRIHHLEINSDGTLLAVGQDEGVRLWDTQTGDDLGLWDMPLTFDPVEPLLMAVGDETRVNLINVETRETLMTFPTLGYPLQIQFSANGHVLAARSGGSEACPGGKLVARQEVCGLPNLQIWNVETGAEIYSTRIEGDFVFALNNDGSRFAVSDRSTTTLVDVPSGENQPVPEVSILFYQYVNELTFSTDNSLLAAGTGGAVHGGTLGASTLWSVDADEAPVLMGDRSGAVYAVDFNPDDTLLVDTTADIYFTEDLVRIWDVTSFQTLAVLYGHHDEVTDAQFSPDGRFIYSAGLDGTVRVWGVPAS